MVKKKELIEFEIKEVGFPNKGRGEFEGHNIKFKGGIEGQKVEARVSRKRKGYIEAKIVNIVEKSPIETEEGCPHFGICGGCTYQSLSYENELELKEKQIKALFEQEELDINFLGIEKSPEVNGYRNKMEYTFGDEEKDGPLALGLHRKGRFYEVVNVENCNIVDKDFTNILTTVLNYFGELNTSYYNKRLHSGFLRHLVVRKALSTGEILVNLVTSSQEELNKEDFINKLNEISTIGKITGIIHTINDGLSDVVKADKLEVLYGRDYIIEEILGLRFQISPFSFFQTNTFGAERLYSMVREFAGDIDDKVVFDLYSGTGTIAQIMAPVAKKVIGIEIVEEAVEKARENAKLNNLDNVEFIAGDVLKAVDELKEKPDLIVIDPPRDGIHPKAINKIIDFNPEVFVYVSCNPVTLVRDLKVFIERGYKVEKAKCMDQFPRTPHVESIILMTHCGSEGK
ncbi:23S rRNA (uracil(1939)-C(5))-methyltransferase RlmD [Tissierella pigra]|uniref:23S rRNA (Uracil(1939)-C(5))-methyltransferase RlmD n=1 Tax=Tissierella pigra TaxID=2607614 RepID=A0A6N7Y2X2_9FIRM|nr:23S rRNA (uracil(1939)-C(5))-methyltransferase RlmD [Tissierella pigra]MBU5427003.1 23S rRNA (uracil(1939)-C(5))-methyltransferase RlmD [Tissierella pigra]MSU02400.1 23S rRNA (uracil(1939)-C(5))-methyltransferase RlmD [Tissierella pigra]